MTNTETFRALIAAWERRSVDDVLALMTPDARYLNVGMPEMVGHEAIRAGLTAFLAASSQVTWTVHHIAEDAGGAVLTERTDDFQMGPRKVTIPVMGVAEFRDGKICRWREYFDVPAFQQQLS